MKWLKQFWKKHICSEVPDELAEDEFGSENKILRDRMIKQRQKWETQ